jgi:hypothetical protein
VTLNIPKRLLVRLRLGLAVLIAAHLGLAQVAIAQHESTAHAMPVQTADSSDSPCHGMHATADESTPQQISHGCCAAGNCHCSAACQAMTPEVCLLMRITGSSAVSTVTTGYEPVQIVPDLRPPIA